MESEKAHTMVRTNSEPTDNIEWELESEQIFFSFFWTFFNASSLQTYIHGAREDMRHWYSEHFINHKHGMNEQEKEVDESIISLQKRKGL